MKPPTEVVAVRIPREESLRLRNLARSRGVPYGQLMHEALASFLARQ